MKGEQMSDKEVRQTMSHYAAVKLQMRQGTVHETESGRPINASNHR